jgi:hypothetical protein
MYGQQSHASAISSAHIIHYRYRLTAHYVNDAALPEAATALTTTFSAVAALFTN